MAKPTKPTSKTFSCTVLGGGPNKAFPFIEPPFDTVEVFGAKGRVPVLVTIRGVKMRMSLAPIGGRHVLGFRRELVDHAKLAVGDTVSVTIERDDAPRTVAVPPALAKALKASAAARAAWGALAYSHQREHAEAIAAAKHEETRARRVAKTIEMLAKGSASRAAPSTKPLAARLHINAGTKVAVLARPKTFSLEGGEPTSLKRAEVVLLFVTSRAALARWVPRVKDKATSAVLWIAYPKTTSGVTTDLTRDVGWEAADRAGLHAVTQVSVDVTWSALRFRVGVRGSR